MPDTRGGSKKRHKEGADQKPVWGRAAGLVLAAGAATRMGTLKQLLPFRNRPLLEVILRETLDSHLNKVILVLGHEASVIENSLTPILRHPKLKVIENRGYREGVSSSIITGLSQVEEEVDHVMILLADMPLISARVIDFLLQKYLHSGLPLGAISLHGKRSHPVIFSRSLYPELHKLTGDTGAKALFQKYKERVCLAEPDFFYEDKDVDTMEDYLEFKGP